MITLVSFHQIRWKCLICIIGIWGKKKRGKKFFMLQWTNPKLCVHFKWPIRVPPPPPPNLESFLTCFILKYFLKKFSLPVNSFSTETWNIKEARGKVFGDKNLHAHSRIFYTSFTTTPYYFYRNVIYIWPCHETFKKSNIKPSNIGH